MSNSREKLCQIARYDIQRYYKTQAVGDRPTTEVAAKVVLQKATVNSYGDSNFYSDTNNAIGIFPSGGEYPLNDTNIKYTENEADGDYAQLRKDLGTKIIGYVSGDVSFTFGSLRGNSTKNVLDVSLANSQFTYPFTKEDYLPQNEGCCLVLIGGRDETERAEQVKVRLVSYVDDTGK
ncbi:hypothetical protein [Eubacterium aggregans]|uniref:hypothetical protein n=1 Tax=Eubacterium aggregans TaxID=81409 RepID=UPI003F3E6A6D